MNSPNQNNDLDEISNIIGNTPGLRKENNVNFNSPYVSSSENNTFHLEFNNESLNFNLPIFENQEKEEKNSTIKEEKTPTEERELYLIERLNNFRISPSSRPFTILNKKRRGRVKRERYQDELKETENEDNDYIKIHDKNTADNLLRKIQVHYLNFIVQFLNEILAFLNFRERFLKLSYEFKSNIKKEFVKSLKTKTIWEIICTQISNKYKKDLYYNRNIYEQTKWNKVLNKIYSQNYLLFFRKIYFKSERKINLKEFGLNKEIIVSHKAQMYKDLVGKEEYFYKKKIKNCINHHFFPDTLFKTGQIQ